MNADKGLGQGFRLWEGQGPLFLRPDNESGATIDERFDKFHAANPWVYEALVKLARGWRAAGHERCGIKMLFEVVRWQWAMQAVETDEPFRLNNNFTSRYVRLISDNEPDLAGMFSTRRLRAA